MKEIIKAQKVLSNKSSLVYFNENNQDFNYIKSLIKSLNNKIIKSDFSVIKYGHQVISCLKSVLINIQSYQFVYHRRT
jgi:hypothetical protein